MNFSTTDDTKSLIRCGQVVGCWVLALVVLPPSGLLWQLGVLNACGTWLVHGLLAALDLTGLVQ